MRRTPVLLVVVFALALAGAALAGVAAHRGATKAKIVVTEREFRITLAPAKVPAGPAMLVVKNVGKFPHALVLSGPGVAKARTATIAPGKSATLLVTLKAGSYSIWCPIGSHAAQGMKATLTAGGAAPVPVSGTTGSTGGADDGGGTAWG